MYSRYYSSTKSCLVVSIDKRLTVIMVVVDARHVDVVGSVARHVTSCWSMVTAHRSSSYKTSYFCLVRPSSVPCQIYFFRFARILNVFRWNSPEVIATTNRLNDCILREIGTATREQDTRENSNRRQSVLPQCQTGADAWRINSQIQCTDDGRCDHGHNFTLI